MQNFQNIYNFPQLHNFCLTSRKFKFRSRSNMVKQSSFDLQRQIRFDPQVQQIEFVLKRCTPSPKQVKFSNPFEFHIKNYQGINLSVLPTREKKKRKPLTSYRKQQTVRNRERSQLTQWERISQEFSDSFF